MAESKFRDIYSIARRIIDRKVLDSILRGTSSDERVNVLKRLVISLLEKNYHFLESLIGLVGPNHPGSLFITSKFSMLRPGLELFKVDFRTEDFNKVVRLFNSVFLELKDGGIV